MEDQGSRCFESAAARAMMQEALSDVRTLGATSAAMEKIGGGSGAGSVAGSVSGSGR
jgi:hypothetical protein